MAVRREETVPELKEYQIPCSWVPITPLKPSQTTEQLICTNWEESQSVEASCLESLRNCTPEITQENLCGSGGFAENFLQEAQCQTEPAYCDLLNLNNVGGGSAEWVASQVNNSHFSGSDLCNMSFSSLLAFAQAGGKNVAGENALTNSEFVASSSDSSQHFHPQFDSRQFTISFGHSSSLQRQENEGLVGGNFEAGLSIPNVSTDGSSTPSRALFNLNSPSRSIKDAGSSKSLPSQFQPMTPDQNNKAAYWEVPARNAIGIDIVSAGKDAQENIFGGGVMELPHNKEKSQLILDQSCTAASRELQENHKPDKGDMVEADLLKTPQQKPRRKKHRPKVIVEGQSKSTPKSSGGKTPAPQETPRVKRKYVRKKGVNNPLEGSTGGTDINEKTPPTGNSVGKRKYVRKKVTNKAEANVNNGTTEKAGAEPPLHAKYSCRRSLNFNPECQVRDGNSLDHQSPYCGGVVEAENLTTKDQSKNEQCRQGTAVTKKSRISISRECTHSTNQVCKDCMEMPAQHLQHPYASTYVHPLTENMFTDQILCQRGKCQVIFSDATHDKEANIVQMRTNPSGRSIPKSTTDSICSSMYLNTERQERGLKRHEMATTIGKEISNRNEKGPYYNSLQKYHSMFSPNMLNSDGSLGCQSNYKKKRIVEQHNVTSSVQHAAFTSENHMKLERYTPRDSCTNFSASTNATGGTQNGRQVFEDLLALEPTGRAKKSRKAPTRVRKVASLMEIHKEVPASSGKATTSRTKQHIEILHGPNAWFEQHVTDTRTLTTEKQANRSMLSNQTPEHSYQKSTMSIEAPLTLTLDYMSPVDTITEQLSQLDLNANSQGLVAYHTNYQEQQALVPFQGGGAVVPFDSSFDQVRRRRRPRPKVDLDDETTRVWRLLLENINNEGIDGTDEEKARWWEEERRVFIGRADSFIARMHLVQGDRRFSPWKGSVVDSVVGVFLTQNVSDHLSSSAFMALAARFPIREKTHPVELHEETLEPNVTEAEVCKTISVGALGLNKEISSVLAYGNDTKSLQDFEGDSVRDVNSVKTSGKNFDGLSSEDNLGGQLADASKDGPVVFRETVTNKSGSSIEEDGRDIEDSLSSQNSTSSPIAQTTERSNSCFCSTSEKPAAGDKRDRFTSSTSVLKLLQIADTVLHDAYEQENRVNASDQNPQGQSRSLAINLENERYLDNATASAKAAASSNTSTGSQVHNLGALATHSDLSQKAIGISDSVSRNELCAAETSGVTSESASRTTFQKPETASFLERSSNNDQSEVNQTSEVPEGSSSQERIFKVQANLVCPEYMADVTGSSSNIDSSRSLENKEVNSNKYNTNYGTGKPIDEPKGKGVRTRKEKERVDWDCLRKRAQYSGRENVRTGNRDSVDWDAVRCADVSVIADTIKERGMNNMLAERIKDFLNRIVRDHGSIDLEWLRGVPPDKAKEYLLSFRGLGLKSVECVRLLTLHHLAFPVDTNVGRIAVRLGWVPLRPLPESLQLHLLELYPVLESIQKYLWPRLCKLDQRTLYELHYQMITFGKVFCTKSKPNCNACPMRGECRHFASAFASARLALPAPGETSIVSVQENKRADQTPMTSMNNLRLPSPHMNQMNSIPGIRNTQPIIEEPASPEPIIEVPASPEPTIAQASVCDIESAFEEDPDEIPTIQLNMEEFTHNLQKIMQQNNELQESDMSKALVALTAEAASIPVPKLKNVSRLRTEHQVYELPDSHPLLEGMDKREPDDPSPYLLAIWTPGETVDSIEPPDRRCNSQGFEGLCTDESCLSCNSIREANSQTVRGTLLIPCRTAMRGSFPLNGTYFQVNEVFSDHESSLLPMAVPREWLWNLPRRTVYFGTSIPTIFKGLSTEGIQYCFWRGFVCVRGFDRKTRAPRPLIARLHFPASRLAKGKGKIDESNQ